MGLGGNPQVLLIRCIFVSEYFFCMDIYQNIELLLCLFVSVLLPMTYKCFIVQHLEQTVVKCCTSFKKRKNNNPQKTPNQQT